MTSQALRLRRRVWAACFALAFCAPAAAQSEPVLVRGFDIAGASTVEIELGGEPFRVQKSGPRTIDVVTPLSTPDYELSEIVRGGRARRVLSARAVDSEDGALLRFILSCDCTHAVSLSDGVVRLEFADPPAADAAEDGKPKSVETAPQERVAAPGGTINAPKFSPEPLVRGRKVDLVAAPLENELVAAETAGAVTKEAEVLLAREKLLKQLSMAAEQGLLDLAGADAQEPGRGLHPPPIDPELAAVAEETVEAETVAPPPVEKPPAEVAAPSTRLPEPPPAPIELPVRTRSAIVKEFRRDRRDTIVAATPCVEDWRLDMTGWAGEAPFNDGVSAYFANLVDEFGDPVAETVNGLVRLYISQGFGAEASKLLKSYEDVAIDAQLLNDLALIVDGSPPTADGPVNTSSRCAGAVAMWADAAGVQSPEGVAPENIDELVVEAFEAAPRNIRLSLGPRLIEQRIAQGDVDGAAAIDAILARMPGDTGEALALARARLLNLQGRRPASEALLRRLAESDAPESKKALLELANAKLQADAPIDAAAVDALGDAALLARGGPLERDLKIAHIRAVGASLGLRAALGEVERERARGRVPAVLLEDAAHAAFEDARLEPDRSAAFVETIMEFDDLVSEAPSGDLARANIAEQLIAAGLPGLAADVLRPTAGRGGADVRLARAETSLRLGDLEAALSEVANLTSDRANALRARIFAAQAQFENAFAEATRAGSEDGIGRAAFRAGEWRASVDDPATPDAYRSLAQAMLRESGDNVRPEADAADEDDPSSRLLDGRPAEDAATVAEDLRLDAIRRALEEAQSARRAIEEAMSDG